MPTTRQIIIRESIKLFQRDGYHGTPVSVILKAAKIPKGSLYHHFPGGKEEVASATLKWLTDEITNHLDSLDQSNASGDEMLSSLAAFQENLLKDNKEIRGSLIAVLASECIPSSARISQELASTISQIETRLENGFKRQNAATPENSAIRSIALLEGAFLMSRIKGVSINPSKL